MTRYPETKYSSSWMTISNLNLSLPTSAKSAPIKKTIGIMIVSVSITTVAISVVIAALKGKKMIWINYLIRVPVAAVISTVFLLFVAIVMLIWAIFIDWKSQSGDWADLPSDWLTLFKVISGIK